MSKAVERARGARGEWPRRGQRPRGLACLSVDCFLPLSSLTYMSRRVKQVLWRFRQ